MCQVAETMIKAKSIRSASRHAGDCRMYYQLLALWFGSDRIGFSGVRESRAIRESAWHYMFERISYPTEKNGISKYGSKILRFIGVIYEGLSLDIKNIPCIRRQPCVWGTGEAGRPSGRWVSKNLWERSQARSCTCPLRIIPPDSLVDFQKV